MSELTATQIPKPADQQAFERANEVLWRCILVDDSVQLHGRSGQKQDGVDLFGLRDGAPDSIVGVQCKLKGEGKTLDPDEVRAEVKKALGFRPLLSEYFIVTTAPDDSDLNELALELSGSASAGREKPLKIRVWGWGTTEREIRRHSKALKAFDPSHTPQGDQLLSAMEEVRQQGISTSLGIETLLREFRTSRVVDTASDERFQTALEGEINGYAELVRSDPGTALQFLRRLQGRLDPAPSGRVRFRIEANIAACQLELGQESEGIAGLIAAYDHDPENPKAAMNKALALMLKGDWAALKAFALEKFPSMPDNAGLAGYYLQAAIGKEALAEVEAALPEPVKSTPEVAISRVRWAMNSGDPGAWRDVAIQAAADHPSDEALSELRANALLERVIAAEGFHYGRVLSLAERADIAEAATILQQRWEKVRGYKIEASRKPISVPLNLTLAYRLLHQTQNAVEIASAAMDWLPDNVEVIERAAAALLEAGRRDEARTLVERIEINSNSVMMRLNLAAESHDWDAVVDLVDNHIDVFPANERDQARAGRIVGLVEKAQPENRKSLLEANRAALRHDPRACSLLAQSARVHGFDELSDGFFSDACAALRDDSSFAARIVVAEEAMRRAEPNVVADVLLGHVDVSRDGPEVRLLADALAHDFPIRERARRFFDELDDDVRSLSTFRRIEAVYHINRGAVADAIPLLKSAFAEDRLLSTFMRLIVTYLRLDDRDAVRELVCAPDLESLSGSALNRMHLAQVLMEFGDRDRAIRLGYEVLTGAANRSDVVLRFFGLLLKPISEPIGTFIGIVGVGAWVRFTHENGDYEALIGEDADRPWGQRAEISNSFVAKAIGLREGASFEHVNGIGVTEVWTVAEVKPRWLRAFHFLSESFGQRFPDAKGFYMLTMKEGDTGPTLEQVRRYSEAVREHANLYLEKNMPIALIAGNRTGGSVGFADYLLSIGEEVRTCGGDADEREQARALIESNEQKGAVLDALTAWRAAELDVFDTLRAVLGPLSLPATELNQLKELVDNQKDDSPGDRMSLGYHNGRYYREILTAEQRAANHSLMSERLGKIEAACLIEPVVIPDTQPDIAEVLLQLPTADAIAPPILAGQGKLLLSDDMMMRQLAREVFQTKGLWLQPVLLVALERKKLTLERYCDCLVLLAAHRHGFLATNVAVLLSVFENDTTVNLGRLQTVLQYLGSKKADPRSHLEIAGGLINELWNRRPRFDIKMQAATGHVLTAMLTRHRRDMWAYWAAHIYAGLRDEPKSYFAGWLAGHFLSSQEVNQVLREAEERQQAGATLGRKSDRNASRRKSKPYIR